MGSVLISVIVPVYNREKTLKRCMDSILNASYPNLELILVDDGSTDGSWNLIQSCTDNRVRSVHVENGGVSRARNIGLDMATGDFIHFVDSDDFIDQDLYSACAGILEEQSPDMLMFQYSVVFPSLAQTYQIPPCAIFQNRMLDRQYILDNILPVLVNIDDRKSLFIESFSWLKLFKRSLIEQFHVRFDESRRQWEDRIFQILFLKYAESFYFLPSYGYYYVMGDSSFSQTYDGSVFDMVLTASRDYSAIVGDLYDCDTDQAKSHYCRGYISTALQQFDIPGVDLDLLRSDIVRTAVSERAIVMFEALQPESGLETSVREAVLGGDGSKVFELLSKEHDLRLREKAKEEKRNRSIPVRLIRKLKRLLQGR